MKGIFFKRQYFVFLMSFTFQEVLIALLLLAAGFCIGALVVYHWWERRVPEVRQDAIDRSRSNLGGQFAEQLAPYFPDFSYSPNELRWMGKPIDYVVFKGMDKNDIQEIIFLEIKSGKSQLNDHQRQIKRLVQGGKVSWEEYRVPEKATAKREVQ